MYKAICMAYNLELHLELVGTHLEWIGEKEPIIRRLPCTYRLHIYMTYMFVPHPNSYPA